uniref:NAD-glutamate dehydrogenase domain-containing protein n=1 Tax=Klebsiella pneumoniae TaxID=573 RepID=UPI0013D0636B
VEDWAKMHAQVLAVVGELPDAPPPLPEAEVRQGRDFLTWLADDHFTFLGYREYQLETAQDDPDECGLRAVPG